MSLLANMVLAVMAGFAFVFVFATIVLVLARAWDDARTIKLRALIRCVGGIALCGFLGAIIMQAFGLWVT